MVAAAVVSLGVVAGALPWPAYSQLLGRFMRLLAAHGEERKVGSSFDVVLVFVFMLAVCQSRLQPASGPLHATAGCARREEVGQVLNVLS